MDALTWFGLFAVTAMLVCYAFEHISRWFILGFALACGLLDLRIPAGRLAVRRDRGDLDGGRAAALETRAVALIGRSREDWKKTGRPEPPRVCPQIARVG